MSDLEKIKKLRQSSGAGFKDCNEALKEASGNIDKAIEVLRIKGISKASKKMSRQANEGVVAISSNEEKASVIEVNCETDFVAKNEDFINFVKEISELNHSASSDLEKLKEHAPTIIDITPAFHLLEYPLELYQKLWLRKIYLIFLL